ncbi:uncharacterized protein LOC130271057 isoform X2 [Hyla sarda]|uniref:uncharacterized protein LOC130271057 isoform X2 n=1 Tax=Hyla sarda TaxID=327740 RepID=UPI0024C3DC3F|nr:uncharacterized protein LOC130271057 isoform X2 [Hyla sarda]
MFVFCPPALGSRSCDWCGKCQFSTGCSVAVVESAGKSVNPVALELSWNYNSQQSVWKCLETTSVLYKQWMVEELQDEIVEISTRVHKMADLVRHHVPSSLPED